MGSEQYKARPFIIVSRLRVNRSSNTLVGVPLSTQFDPAKQAPHRILIPATQIIKDVSFRGQVQDGVAKTDQIRALDRSRLGDRMGKLTTTALASVGLGLTYIFDL